MTLRAKTILAALVAITLAGVGYFFIKPKSEILPPVNILPKTEEIDTLDWRVYRSEAMGFEIKFPKTISKQGEYIGNPIPDAQEFWQDQVGQAWFITTKPPGPQFIVKIKDSDLSLEEFLGSSWEEYLVINGLSAKRHKVNQTNLGKVRFGEFVVIKDEKRYYYIDFSSGFDSSEMTEKTKIIWETILMTFKPISK